VAMIKIQPMLSGRKSRMLLQVHDELVFEIAKGEEKLVNSLKDAMETAIPLDVPVVVDASMGPNWLEAK
jgi:DNA polymerase-1